MATHSHISSPDNLLAAFRIHYHRFKLAITDAITNPTDSTVLARLGDDLNEFLDLVIQVSLDCITPILFETPWLLQ